MRVMLRSSCYLSPHINDAGGEQVRVLLDPREPEHPDDDLSDLIQVDGPPVVRIKSQENPVELLLHSGHVLHVGGLIPLEEVQCPGAILVEDSEQSLVENIFLT